MDLIRISLEFFRHTKRSVAFATDLFLSDVIPDSEENAKF